MIDLATYQRDALSMANPAFIAPHEAYQNGVLGVIGEIGEIADDLKKVFYQGHEFSRERHLLELGDLCWYVSLACHARKIGFGTYNYLLSAQDSWEPLEPDLATRIMVKLAGQIEAFGSEDQNNRIATSGFNYAVKKILEIVVFLANCVKSHLGEILELNLKKLRTRYGGNFSAEKSIDRTS